MRISNMCFYFLGPYCADFQGINSYKGRRSGQAKGSAPRHPNFLSHLQLLSFHNVFNFRTQFIFRLQPLVPQLVCFVHFVLSFPYIVALFHQYKCHLVSFLLSQVYALYFKVLNVHRQFWRFVCNIVIQLKVRNQAIRSCPRLNRVKSRS